MMVLDHSGIPAVVLVVAGRRADLPFWGLVLSVAYGLFVGGIILVLQALLWPGEGTLQAMELLLRP